MGCLMNVFSGCFKLIIFFFICFHSNSLNIRLLLKLLFQSHNLLLSMLFWKLSHLQTSQISSILSNYLRHKSVLTDKHKLIQSHQLVYSLACLINEQQKYPWLAHKQDFLLTCISLFYMAQLQQVQKGCLLKGTNHRNEQILYVLSGQLHRTQKQFLKQKKKQMRPSLIHSILKQKNGFSIYSNLLPLKAIKKTIFLSLPLQSVFNVKRQAKYMHMEQICKVLSQKMLVQQEYLLKFQIHHKLRYHCLKMGSNFDDNNLPGLILINQGQLLCYNGEGDSFLAVQDSLLTLYDPKDQEKISYLLKATKNTIFLTLSVDLLKQFVGSFQIQTKKYVNFCHRIAENREQFFKQSSYNRKNKNKNENLTIFQLKNLTSLNKQKRRFSRYQEKLRQKQNFENQDFFFIDVLVSNKIIQSKQKVDEMRIKDNNNIEQDKIYRYCKQQSHKKKKRVPTSGRMLNKQTRTDSLSASTKKNPMSPPNFTKSKFNRYSSNSTLNSNKRSITLANFYQMTTQKYENLRNSDFRKNVRINHNRSFSKKQEISAQNNSLFTVCTQGIYNVDGKQNKYVNDFRMFDLQGQSGQQKKPTQMLKKHKVFSKNKYGRIIMKKP